MEVARGNNRPLYERLIRFSKGVFTVRKFLLVTLIGMAFVIYLYGIVNKFMVEEVNEIDHIKETTVTVYME